MNGDDLIRLIDRHAAHLAIAENRATDWARQRDLDKAAELRTQIVAEVRRLHTGGDR